MGGPDIPVEKNVFSKFFIAFNKQVLKTAEGWPSGVEMEYYFTSGNNYIKNEDLVIDYTNDFQYKL